MRVTGNKPMLLALISSSSHVYPVDHSLSDLSEIRNETFPKDLKPILQETYFFIIYPLDSGILHDIGFWNIFIIVSKKCSLIFFLNDASYVTNSPKICTNNLSSIFTARLDDTRHDSTVRQSLASLNCVAVSLHLSHCGKTTLTGCTCGFRCK